MIHFNHATEDSVVETSVKVLKGKSGDDNFKIDLAQSHYVIKDTGGTDTLTFKNTKKDDLEYSYKDGHAYIRDKKTKNVVTFQLDMNNTTVIEKIDIDGKTYDVKDLLVSNHLPPQRATSPTDVTDINDIRTLKDKVSDYTEKDVRENYKAELSAGAMIEYMAGFKDLGQELGIQRLPHMLDFNPKFNIVETN